jgi:hypothetical protein
LAFAYYCFFPGDCFAVVDLFAFVDYFAVILTYYWTLMLYFDTERTIRPFGDTFTRAYFSFFTAFVFAVVMVSFTYFFTYTETYFFIFLAPTDLPFCCFSASSFCFMSSAFVGFLFLDFGSTF